MRLRATNATAALAGLFYVFVFLVFVYVTPEVRDSPLEPLFYFATSAVPMAVSVLLVVGWPIEQETFQSNSSRGAL